MPLTFNLSWRCMQMQSLRAIASVTRLSFPVILSTSLPDKLARGSVFDQQICSYARSEEEIHSIPLFTPGSAMFLMHLCSASAPLVGQISTAACSMRPGLFYHKWSHVAQREGAHRWSPPTLLDGPSACGTAGSIMLSQCAMRLKVDGVRVFLIFPLCTPTAVAEDATRCVTDRIE